MPNDRILPEHVFRETLSYLYGQPYEEVFMLIRHIESLESAPSLAIIGPSDLNPE